MRVLIVTHRYPPFGISGVERLSEQTVGALIDRGHDVTVLTRRESAAPPLPQLQLTERRGVPVTMIAGGGRLHGRFPGHQPRLELLFERTLLEVSPDVLLISHLMGHSPLYVEFAHRWSVPVVLELHDFFVACERAHLERVSGELCSGPMGGRACAQHCFHHDEYADGRWALRTHQFRHALEQADEIVCPSDFVADYFASTFSLPARPTVIANGVDVGTPRASPPSRAAGPLRLAYLGMVAPHKGVHVVIEALRLALLPPVRLTLFGGLIEPYFRSLRASADEVENLELLAYGSFTPTDLPLLLADVDAVIVPSLVWETYSTVTREALSLGVPVIASRSGALPEAIRDGDNGILFAPGSATELARILHRLANDRSWLERLRQGIRPSDWSSVAQRTSLLETVLLKALKKRATPARAHGLEELAAMRDGLR